MPKFEITFERSAIEVKRYHVTAKNEAAAEARVRRCRKGKPIGKDADLCVRTEHEFYGDGESSWELVDTQTL